MILNIRKDASKTIPPTINDKSIEWKQPLANKAKPEETNPIIIVLIIHLNWNDRLYFKNTLTHIELIIASIK